MKLQHLFLLAAILDTIMFSFVARAFSSPRMIRPKAHAAASMSTVSTRFFSTESPDTSIVDLCKQKIQDALEADAVKVTGASMTWAWR